MEDSILQFSTLLEKLEISNKKAENGSSLSLSLDINSVTYSGSVLFVAAFAVIQIYLGVKVKDECRVDTIKAIDLTNSSIPFGNFELGNGTLLKFRTAMPLENIAEQGEALKEVFQWIRFIVNLRRIGIEAIANGIISFENFKV